DLHSATLVRAWLLLHESLQPLHNGQRIDGVSGHVIRSSILCKTWTLDMDGANTILWSSIQQLFRLAPSLSHVLRPLLSRLSTNARVVDVCDSLLLCPRPRLRDWGHCFRFSGSRTFRRHHLP